MATTSTTAAARLREIAFVSSDKDEGAFDAYWGEMPWLALPYADRARKEALSKHFGVSGIPSLVVLAPAAPDGSRAIVTTSARGAVGADPDGKEFPWFPKPCEELSATVECNGSDINEKPALICLMDGADDDEQAALAAMMLKVATESFASDKTGGGDKAEPSLIFFTARSSEGAVGRVREVTKLKPSPTPVLLLLDIPDNGGFFVRGESEGELDEASIKAYVAAYKAGTLDRQQLS